MERLTIDHNINFYLQVWRVKFKASAVTELTFLYGVAHDFGTTLAIKFCPYGTCDNVKSDDNVCTRTSGLCIGIDNTLY